MNTRTRIAAATIIITAVLVPAALATAAEASVTAPVRPQASGVSVSNSAGPCATARADLLRRVNSARAAKGRRALTLDSRLNSSAQTHSRAMAAAGRMTHDRWITEIRQTGYPVGWWTQNVAWGQTSGASVMNDWMHSPVHKTNILDPKVKRLGVGCARRGTTGNRYYWTQNFGA